MARVTALAGRLMGRDQAACDRRYLSRWLATVVAIVVAGEAIVMGVLSSLPPLSPWLEAGLDSFFLVLLVSPALWLLVRQVARRLDSAEQLRLTARMGAIVSATADGIVVTDAGGLILLSLIHI